MPFLTGKAEAYVDQKSMDTLLSGFSIHPKQILKSLEPKTRKAILSDEDKMFKEISLYGIDFSVDRAVKILEIDVLGITVVLEASFGYSSNEMAKVVFSSGSLGFEFNNIGIGYQDGFVYGSASVPVGNTQTTVIRGVSKFADLHSVAYRVCSPSTGVYSVISFVCKILKITKAGIALTAGAAVAACAYVPELVAVYCANVAAVYGPAIAVLIQKLLSGASASKVAQEMPSVIRSLGKAFA